MKQPNLIYVFADQLRYDALGFNGSETAKTPKIDELSRECLCLENAISGHPVCAPYRASLFTGKYTNKTGMVINELRINTDHRAIGHVLTEGGYETCYIGKWHLYANQLGHHYDTKNSFIPRGADRLGFDDVFAGYNFHHEYYAPNAYYHLESENKELVEGYEPDFQVDYALSHLKRMSEGEKPFAMFLSIGTPHDPWVPENVPKIYLDMFKDVEFKLPKNYCEKNDKHADLWAILKPKERKELCEWQRVYAAMVANLDENIGRFVDGVKALGLWENSIFVFTSDHGEMFGSHGRRAKNIFYEEACHVPFLMHYGNKFKSGRTDFMLNTVDIIPSLLSLMKLPIPSEVQGEDKSSCMLGKCDCLEGKNEFTDGSLLMGTGPTAIYGIGREWRGYRTKTWKYAIYKIDKEEHLYNLEEDPLEMHNLAHCKEYADIKKKLSDAMHEKMSMAEDEFLSCLEFKRRYIKNRIIQCK